MHPHEKYDFHVLQFDVVMRFEVALTLLPELHIPVEREFCDNYYLH